MPNAKTLLELAGADLSLPPLSSTALVLIDYQNEYLDGPISLPDAHTAVKAAAQLLARARQVGAKVIHIAHAGRAGGLFDRSAHRGAIIEDVQPLDGEVVVEKTLPNAFAGTGLKACLEEYGADKVVLLGFMTHMCVSATARVALDLGFRAFIDAPSCTTRSLPDGRGGVIAADTVHAIALAELADRFAVVNWTGQWQ